MIRFFRRDTLSLEKHDDFIPDEFGHPRFRHALLACCLGVSINFI